MFEDYSPTLVPAAQDDILAIFRELHRHQCAFDPEADSTVELSRESTIADWRRACDLVAWRELAEWMNEDFSVAVRMEEWRAVLDPAKSHMLGEVCDLLARHATLPRVRPVNLLGSICFPAGAFLSVRSLLAAAGADVSEVAPSTPLADYARRYSHVFLGPVARLSPGALPTVRISTPLYHGCIVAFLSCWLGIVVGSCAGLYSFVVLAAVGAMMAYVGIWFAARWTLPASVEFGNLRTFRDLSNSITQAASPRY